MFPFDLSTADVILIAVVAASLISFILILMKLSPSEREEEIQIDTVIEKEELFQAKESEPLAPSAEDDAAAPVESPSTAPTEGEPLVISAAGGVVTPVESPPTAPKVKAEEPSVQADPEDEPQTPTPAIDAAVQGEAVKSPPEKKGMSKTLSRMFGKRDCVHHFGYLATLSKNAPLPDECLGCLKALECLFKGKRQKG